MFFSIRFGIPLSALANMSPDRYIGFSLFLYTIALENYGTLDIFGGGGSSSIYHEPDAIIINSLEGGG